MEQWSKPQLLGECSMIPADEQLKPSESRLKMTVTVAVWNKWWESLNIKQDKEDGE